MPFICQRCRQCVLDEANFPATSCPACGGELAAVPSLAAQAESALAEDQEEIPERIGRYEIREKIGAGATGEVYRGYDIGLRREVAVKVPRALLTASQETANAFLAEARILASLDHPHILPIFDLGRTEAGLCFLVCKLFERPSLKDLLARGRPAVAEAVDWVRCLAEALDHAHRQGLVHRDVKPANVLFDAEGRPVLADFDLALHPRDFGKGPSFVGTVSYMSPEQARLEGHRVDARTDIYSLGVVLYEVLTGRRPFESDKRDELLKQIKTCEPVPPRQFDPALPAELDRICFKAMAKLPSLRYPSARDLTEDLKAFQMNVAQERLGKELHRPAATAPPPAAFVPRGLRAFGPHDADFFPELLPGPRDRAGLPDLIRFWKDRLDSVDPENTFRVGLMLGPTGCGKSSLLQAGVLPRLAGHVRAFRVEATAEETESRLAASLRKNCPGIMAQGGLAETFGRLRLGEVLPQGKKKVAVLFDQFEQWLHAHPDYADTELVAALRQCDGVHLQAVLLVRDDFSLAAARFLHEVEAPIVEGVNFATVDRFLPTHARKVLTAFGRAYGALPAEPSPLTHEHEAFLSQAVTGLSEEGLVIPVRLVLLAETMKDRPWTPAALREAGGATGSAVLFLEKALGSRAVNPAHRPYHQAACAVLQNLLPARGAKLKGMKRPVRELLDASGLADRRGDFDALMDLLSGELRLITPLQQEGAEPESASVPAYYQLTHDYLVSPLRLWLTQQQRVTRRGRAQLSLAEFSDDWNALREDRRLPGAWTWAAIALLTGWGSWTGPQQAMMRAAARHYLVRGAVVLVLLLLFWQGWRYLGRREAAELAAQRAADQVAQLRSAPIRNVSAIIAALERDWSESEPRLRAALRETDDHPRQRRNLRLALLPADPGQAEPLGREMLSARPDELLVLRQSLLPYQASLSQTLWEIVATPRQDASQRLRAAGALAEFDPKSPRWDEAGKVVAADLLEHNPLELPLWLEVFRPIRMSLLKPLRLSFHDPAEGRRRLAAVVLADYAADQPALLLDLLLSAAPEQYPVIWRPFQKYSDQASGWLNEELDRAATAGNEDDRAEAARRQAQAAVILLQLGHAQRVWPLLRLRSERTVRSYLILLLAKLRTDPSVLVARWRQENDAGARDALILTLGEIAPDRIDPRERQALVADWLKLYREDPEPGLHAAIDWTLRRRWNHEDAVRAVDKALAGEARGKNRWFVNSQEQTFVLFPGPVELPATATDNPGMRIPRSFAVSSKDVTVAQYDRFQQAHPDYRYPDFPTQYIEGPQSPMIWLTWFDAAAYCRWLSEREGVHENEMCYPPLARIKPGMKLPADYLSRTGYRLPTAAEWQYAVRAGTTSPRFFGRGEALIAQYGWYANNAAAHVHPVGSLKPNGFGLFDVYGNVWQWSQDRAFRPKAADDREDTTSIEETVPRLILGGSFTDQSFQLSTTSFVPRRPTECHVNYGMRLARTVR